MVSADATVMAIGNQVRRGDELVREMGMDSAEDAEFCAELLRRHARLLAELAVMRRAADAAAMAYLGEADFEDFTAGEMALVNRFIETTTYQREIYEPLTDVVFRPLVEGPEQQAISILDMVADFETQRRRVVAEIETLAEIKGRLPAGTLRSMVVSALLGLGYAVLPTDDQEGNAPSAILRHDIEREIEHANLAQ